MSEIKLVEVTVAMAPSYVQYECPECGAKIQHDFKDFRSNYGYHTEWDGLTITCAKCEKEIKINNVDWD